MMVETVSDHDAADSPPRLHVDGGGSTISSSSSVDELTMDDSGLVDVMNNSSSELKSVSMIIIV